MPRLKKTNGDNIPDTTIQYSWITIPSDYENDKSTIDDQSFMVNPAVADYIEFLEAQRPIGNVIKADKTQKGSAGMRALNDSYLQHKVLNEI